VAVANFTGTRWKKPTEMRGKLLIIFSVISTVHDGSRVQRLARPYLLEASCEGRREGGKLFASYVTMDIPGNELVKGKCRESSCGTAATVTVLVSHLPREVSCGV
jgi:hypothetical protein